MGSERLNFVLLNDADAVRLAQSKTNKEMIQAICDILKETYESHTESSWDVAANHVTMEEVTKVLMKSAQQYHGRGANKTTIRNINTLVKARKQYKIDFKKMLYRSVRWYADDNQRVAKNKNGYMAMLLRDIRTLMSSERLIFVLLNDADAVRVAKAKTNKKMIQVICDILKETYESHTESPWDIATSHDTKEEATKVLMKSAQQYHGWEANKTTIRNINTLIKARKRYRIAFKEMLYRSVRWYADDNQRVTKNKNGYMAMLLCDIRTLMYWK